MLMQAFRLDQEKEGNKDVAPGQSAVNFSDEEESESEGPPLLLTGLHGTPSFQAFSATEKKKRKTTEIIQEGDDGGEKKPKDWLPAPLEHRPPSPKTLVIAEVQIAWIHVDRA